ncbi:TadE/TadG family type IV pilus assembly protein [Devosia sp.]|uniref:TadE/TadG family type IV pilus assembly protein n=1 Tax=Devosia sp. TaxID=1871048 RepID=UPI001ACC05AE|nr:TadE/TadG family type IV pilus assembly protein [Devosia sp.]MBN9311146.1 pilus assembly protein [Devosia sp.]
MRTFADLLKRFHADERGVFAVIFGLLAIVLVAFAGAAVDYSSVETARTRAQVALDSAALGLQPTIFSTPAPTSASLKASALALLNERLNDSSAVTAVDVATFDTGNGTLHLEATLTVNTAFVQLVGIPSLTARVVSEATRKRINLEVALVLDNSGSMAQLSRMTNLKKAALCAMNVLYNALDECTDAKVTATNDVAPTEQRIWMGIVPFTGFVNVGTGYKNASWMDTTGLSSIANDNFDDDDNDATPYNGAVNRFSLYTKIGVAWRGCVEARPYPYDTDDTPPSTANPDTLFVPEFAPDTPSGYSNSYINDRPSACTNKDGGTWTKTSKKTGCAATWSGNNETKKAAAYTNCTSSATDSYAQVKWDGSAVTPAATTQPATMQAQNGAPIAATCSNSYTSVTVTTGSGRNAVTTYTLSLVRTCSYQFSDRVLQERLCKYASGNAVSGGSPNDDCPTNPMTPLTATKADIKTAINAMASQGYTNIHQGAIWGFHMLSPTEPLTQGADYGGATSKVMIIMTDGENTVNSYGANALNMANTFQAYGWPGARSQTGGVSYNGRIYSTDHPYPASDADVTAAMDTRTEETCTNAKAEGIAIYTIGLNPPNQKTIDLLTNCATTASMAYFPTDSSQLVTVFKKIADELANLRLSQ